MFEIIPFGPYMINIFNLLEFLIGLTAIAGSIYLFLQYIYKVRVSFVQVLRITYLFGFGLAFTGYAGIKNINRGRRTGGIYSFYGIKKPLPASI